jgi:tripartite-type tricarboxylate transporter receptor subunit TctC
VPDLPTIKEGGVKGYDIGFWFVTHAPTMAPQAIVTRLKELLTKAAKSASVKAAFYASGRVDVFFTPSRNLLSSKQTNAKIGKLED